METALESSVLATECSSQEIIFCSNSTFRAGLIRLPDPTTRGASTKEDGEPETFAKLLLMTPTVFRTLSPASFREVVLKMLERASFQSRLKEL